MPDCGYPPGPTEDPKDMICRDVARRLAMLCLLGALAPMTVRAQGVRGSIEGTVTAEEGRPLHGATVSTGGPGQVVTTDSLGRYLLGHVPPGDRRVTVRAQIGRASCRERGQS